MTIVSLDVATVPDERYDDSRSEAYSSAIEKDLTYKLCPLLLTRQEYSGGKLPQWFGPHKDRIALM